MKTISVVIPVRNGAATLDKCLTSIRQQTFAGQVEIVILDSSSTDRSVEIALSYGAVVVPVAKGTFNHGLTRNLALPHTNGNFIYLTVQDAYLSANDQLDRMVRLFDDEQLMAVTGMQAVPHDLDKNPALWFRRFSKPGCVYKQIEKEQFRKLSRDQQYELIKEWDDVNAMYRRAALIQLPFRETEFAEDKLWAHDALSMGMKLAYDSSLLVYHYHHATFSYSFKSAYTISYHLWKYFSILPRADFWIKQWLSNVFQVFRSPGVQWTSGLYWSIHNLVRLFAIWLSSVVFKSIRWIAGPKWLTRSHAFFCNKIPQGRVKIK